MEDIDVKMARNKKWTYMGHLADIETWLFTISEKPDDPSKITEKVDQINKSCSYVVDNFDEVIANGIALEKRIMVVVATLNTLIRVYTIDKSTIIGLQENLQSIINVFTRELCDICETILLDDEEDAMDIPDLLSTKFANRDLLKKYATNIFYALLTNFAKDDLLKKCLDSLFSSEVPSDTGTDATRDQFSKMIRGKSKRNLAQIMSCTAYCAQRATIRSVDDFDEKYRSLMDDLCMFVDKFFDNASNLLGRDKSYINIVSDILTLVWNLTDKTPLVPLFVKADYAETTVKWIQKLSSKSEYDLSRLNDAVMSIIHNLSRDKKGLAALRENHAFKILMKYKSLLHWDQNSKLDDLTRTYAMSLIALGTNDNEQTENKDLICKVSEELYFLCENAARSPSLRYDGFHLSELLNSLEGALSNQTTVRHILGEESKVKPESIIFFAKLLISFYGLLLNQEADYHEEIIVKSLLKILLYLSSYAEYRQELNNHGQFCVLIEGLTKRPKQDTAKRICSNLKLDAKSKVLYHPLEIYKQPMIYISYNWADPEFCKPFVKALRKVTEVPIWVDYEKAKWFDDMWDHIASAIKHAAIIVVLLSSAYCDSKINFQELSYAVTLAKNQSRSGEDSIIFVETEADIVNKREWISNISKDKTVIPYNDDREQTFRKVNEHDIFSKKRRGSVTHSSDIAAQSRVCTIM